MSDMMKKMSQGKRIPSGMIPDEMLNQLKYLNYLAINKYSWQKGLEKILKIIK